MRVLEAMEPDSRHQLLASLPEGAINCLIARLSEEFQAAVHSLFSFPQHPPVSLSERLDCDDPDWWEVYGCGD